MSLSGPSSDSEELQEGGIEVDLKEQSVGAETERDRDVDEMDLLEEMKGLKDEIRELRDKLDNSWQNNLTENAELKGKLCDANREKEELRRERDSLKDMKERQESAENEALKRQLDDAKKQMAALEEMIANLSRQVQEANSEKEKLRKERDTLRGLGDEKGRTEKVSEYYYALGVVAGKTESTRDGVEALLKCGSIWDAWRL